MKSPQRGEVWLVDLGLAAKVRPALVLSLPPGDSDRALVTIVPHTTAVRGTAFEVATKVRFLRPGAFDPQSLVSIPLAKLVRRLGALDGGQLDAVELGVCRWLGLSKGGGARHNEALQQTKPAFLSDCAGFAAERRCCAD